MSDERYVFVAQWYDSAASLVRSYNFTFFAIDNTIEMYDIKNKKLFLRRCEYPSITIKDLFIGSVVNVYSRQLKLVDYADQFTKSKFSVQRGRTYAMIQPDCYMNIGKVIHIIENSDFALSNIKMFRMQVSDAQEFYSELKGKPLYQGLTQFMASDLSVGMELVAEDCIAKWKKLLGPADPRTAKKESPQSIRALFGEEGVRNACHGSDSLVSAQRELDFVFSQKSRLKCPAVFNNCTCCIIKPHAIAERKVGQILDIILTQGFEISAMQMFWLDKPTAEEFLQVYKGVLPDFTQIALELTSGPCIALQVRQENAVQTFRDLCGPHDPELARQVRPKSLRALFGKDKAKNAVHCTDLPEDGILEVEYFFNILQYK